MPWGERVAYVADPDGNPVALAAALAYPSIPSGSRPSSASFSRCDASESPAK